MLPNNTITFQTSNRSDIGYQAIPLQDSYVSAASQPPGIYKVQLVAGLPVTLPNTVYITAASAGTWANSASSTSGLVVNVAPGSAPDTKKLVIYLDGGVVETIDNLNFTDPTASNWAPTVINGNSANINIIVNSAAETPASTRAPWNLQIASTINSPGLTGGYNGENASTSDFIGTLDPSTDTFSGLSAFNDPENVNVNCIFVPGRSDTGILQELALIGANTNVLTLGDVPYGLTAREAVDWHNGSGVYNGNGRINSAYLAIYWNWLKLTDYFTGQTIWAPPSIGAARCLCATFDNYAPWFAPAGPKRGVIPEALGVQFPRPSLPVRDSMYGNGNSVNPIFSKNGSVTIDGERTMQVAETELSVVHVVNLVNYLVVNFSVIGDQFSFDPNDLELLSEIESAFNNLLRNVAGNRGLEGYNAVCDPSNNTAATRNARTVVVGVYIIPTETMERLLVTLSVQASGASLVSVTTVNS